MGNILQISITCDGAIFNRCLDCFLGKAAYARNLQGNLVALETQLKQLVAKKDDVMNKVVIAEQQQMKRLNQVQFWVSRVEAAVAEADKLIGNSSREIDKLCLGGHCSTDCKSSYKFGKQVAVKMRDVKELMLEGAFEVVAERDSRHYLADERPTEPTVVGLGSQLEQVWRCLVEESAGIVGLFGMGGVGKTTLLTHINNRFLESSTNFDCVLWVVVSKDHQLEKVQEVIGGKMGLYDDSWNTKSIEEKAVYIFRALKKKKFVLLLDDIWGRVDLTKIGVPLHNPQNSGSKVVFTTRSEEVCGFMEAEKKFKVTCLSDRDAWELFRQKVGEETLNCHPDIIELAQVVAKECGGLPLALITIGRAMSCKRTPEEWRHSIQVLRISASQFPGLDKEVYSLLKFSYDNLPSDTIRSCLLYCSLFPEDYQISKEDLIDCWIGECFLDDCVKFGVQNQGYYILGVLLHACLLEEVEDDGVKMHDVIRDMTLWIACDIEMNKGEFLVYAGSGLSEAPDAKEWENVRRLSLMQNQIENLSKIPECPHLLTLFLNNNPLKVITNDFFQFMSSLKVLRLSVLSFELKKFPPEISNLVSLHHLDLSGTRIEELPEELKGIVNLKCLNLNRTVRLKIIPKQMISNFSRLHVLRIFGTGTGIFGARAAEESILFGGSEVLVEELLGLKYLEALEVTLNSCRALQRLLSLQKLHSCIQSLFLNYLNDLKSLHISALADVKHLKSLHIENCEKFKEITMDCTFEVQNMRQPFVFRSLQRVEIAFCSTLKDSTFLVYAPNIKSIDISHCGAMTAMVDVGKFANVPANVMINLHPFVKLQQLNLVNLPNLKSIHWEPLPLPCLKEMIVDDCYKLRNLPLDSNSARGNNIVIRGDYSWKNQLLWEDEAARNVFLPRFKYFGE